DFEMDAIATGKERNEKTIGDVIAKIAAQIADPQTPAGRTINYVGARPAAESFRVDLVIAVQFLVNPQLVQFRLTIQGENQRTVTARIPRLDAQSFLKRLDRLVDTSIVAQCKAEVAVNAGQRRINV